MTVPRGIRGTVLVPVVVVLRVLDDGVCHIGQPGAVLEGFQHVRSAKELDAVDRRIAERLKEAGGHERGNRRSRAIQQPRHLLDREPCGQLAAQRQKSMLFFVHGSGEDILPSA